MHTLSATHCNTLQHVAVCCRESMHSLPSTLFREYHVHTLSLERVKREYALCMLQCVQVRCSVLQCIAVPCSALQCIAVPCSALQCVAVCCSVMQCANVSQRIAVCCSTAQCAAECCRVLQKNKNLTHGVRAGKIRKKEIRTSCIQGIKDP